MNTSSDTLASKALADAATRRILIGWLPIIGVGLVIFWLSGGIPPTAWRLLIQMLSHWSALHAFLGTGLFLPFLVVLAQSIMILVAWIILAITIRHEVSVVNIIQAQHRVLSSQKALFASQAAPEVETEKQQVQMIPQEEDDPDMSESIDIPDSAGGDDENDELFDANMAVFELLPEPEAVDVEEETSAALPQARVEETLFVYGNPFDGELPEVFEYDQDLKREVQDMQEELRARQSGDANNKSQKGKPAKQEDGE